MKKESSVFAMAVLFCLLGCADLGTHSPAPNGIPGTVWVGKHYVGGVQCSGEEYVPPDTRKVLAAARIPVLQTAIEYWLVCHACGCPEYAATHYALISRVHILQAEQLGFTQREPPP